MSLVHEVLPPLRFYSRTKKSVFLAGSIEMGKAEDWQKEAVEWMELNLNSYVTVYNPRRPDWDPSWKQSLDDVNFNNQVNWELDFIEHADVVFIVFKAGTVSPISLYELGVCVASGKKLVVVVEPEYFRRGNIEVVCNRAGIKVWYSIESALFALKKIIA